MQIVIEISSYDKEWITNGYYIPEEINMRISEAIAHGSLLDDVKTEIAEEVCLTDNPYTKETKYTIEHSKLLDILDHIGKESEE